MEKGKSRLLELEGLRGFAAIAVAFFHAILIFWCYAIYGKEASGGIQNMRFEDNLYGNPFFGLYSGIFAVAIFFVLSGFVLSVGYFSTGKIEIIQKLAAKRYIRLMLPALASVMIAWLLITIGLSHNPQAFAITHSVWLSGEWNLVPNFFEALWQGTWAIFTIGQPLFTSGPVSYNPVLWTMLYEFVGSFIVFGTVGLFGKLQKRWIVYLFLVLLTFQTWYLGFVIGMVLADQYAARRFPFNGVSWRFMLFILTVGVFFGGYPFFGPTSTSLYSTLEIFSLTNVQNLSLYTTIGAMFLIVGVLTVPFITRFFSSKIISSLGKYTFSLYLVHKPVLFTLTTGLFVWLYSFMGFNRAALMAIVISIPFLMLVTYVFEKYVDAPSIRLSGIFANWLLGLPQKLNSEQPLGKNRFRLKFDKIRNNLARLMSKT